MSLKRQVTKLQWTHQNDTQFSFSYQWYSLFLQLPNHLTSIWSIGIQIYVCLCWALWNHSLPPKQKFYLPQNPWTTLPIKSIKKLHSLSFMLILHLHIHLTTHNKGYLTKTEPTSKTAPHRFYRKSHTLEKLVGFWYKIQFLTFGKKNWKPISFFFQNPSGFSCLSTDFRLFLFKIQNLNEKR
jgi:hypothetical protein